MGAYSERDIYAILEEVSDPEIPVLSILDLGIVRDVQLAPPGVSVTITPTYSGCPAMQDIEGRIRSTLEDNGIWPIEVVTVLSPPWTTDWMTDAGKKKLAAYGIAPPSGLVSDPGFAGEDRPRCCPQCGSPDTVLISQFGSTPCKSLYKCNDCLEPFDYFKCH